MLNNLISYRLLKYVCAIGVMFSATNTFAQTERELQKNLIIEQRIELLSEALGDEELDLNTVFDKLSDFYDHPINLNKTNKEELQELLMLTDIQIEELFDHIARYGKLISIYELQSLRSFDMNTIYNILPFVFVSDKFDAPHASFAEMWKYSSNELFIRWSRILEEQGGYAPISDSALAESPNSRYPGSPDRLYTRYRLRSGNYFSAGFTAEKDAGEQFFKGAQKNGFDFYSAHLFVRDISIFKSIALGDYQVSFGQGLTFASGLAFGKNANTLGIKRVPYNIKPYTSADENQFMRGAATTIALKNFELTAFYSRKKIDANVTSDTAFSDDDVIVSSFLTSGIHATPNEVADKDAISEQHIGGHIAYKTRRLNIGATAVSTQYGGALEKDLGIYNQFDFIGNKNLVMGTDYSFVIKNFNFFGEVSRSLNGGMAHTHSAIIALDSRFAISLNYRNFSRDYQNLVANALAESSRPVNEKGFFWGAEVRPSNAWTINFYFDGFKSDWLRSGIDAPSRGYEYLGQATWRPNKKTELYVRARKRNKQENTDVDDIDGITYLVNNEQENYRFQVTYQLTESISLRNRCEYVNIDKDDEPSESGYLLYQDVNFKPLSSPVSFNFRYAIFNTDSYNSRLYAYESDVLYYYAVPAYYYKGTRIYLTLRYQIKRVDLWLRWGQFLYDNRTTLSSGLSEIQGNKKTEVRVQLRFRF